MHKSSYLLIVMVAVFIQQQASSEAPPFCCGWQQTAFVLVSTTRFFAGWDDHPVVFRLARLGSLLRYYRAWVINYSLHQGGPVVADHLCDYPDPGHHLAEDR